MLKDVAKGAVDESPASTLLGKRVDKLISSLEQELQEVGRLRAANAMDALGRA